MFLSELRPGALAVLTLLLALGAPVYAQGVPDFPRTDDYLLLEYHRFSLKFANRDKTPALRIYGSGRAVVYWPAYTPRAGIYELQLPAKEVDRLVGRATQSALHTVDSVELVEVAEKAEAKRRETSNVVYYTSDQTLTELSVFLPGARKYPLVATNLLDTNKRLPGLPGVADFAALARELQAVVDGELGVAKGQPTPMSALKR